MAQKGNVAFQGYKNKKISLKDHTMTKFVVLVVDAEGNPILDESKKEKTYELVGELAGMDQYQRNAMLKTKTHIAPVIVSRIVSAVQNEDIVIPAGCSLPNLPEWVEPATN